MRVLQMSLRYCRLLVLGLIVPMLFPGCSSAPRRLDIIEIAPGVFDGRKPRSKADFEALRAKGIRTIVSLQTVTWDIAPERKLATQSGMGFVNVPIPASPFGPTERKVQTLFQTMSKKSLQPVYVHCLLGRDRTGVLMALYRVYYQDCDPKLAWSEMIQRGGFRSRWALVGFSSYYWHHCDKPPWATEVSTQKPRLRTSTPGGLPDHNACD